MNTSTPDQSTTAGERTMLFTGERGSWQFIRYFITAYPARSAWMIVFLILSSLAEGVGLFGMVPVLELGMTGDRSSLSPVAESVVGVVDWLRIPPTLPYLISLIVIMLWAKAGFLWVAMRQVGYTGAYVTYDLRQKMLQALFQSRWRFFIDHPIGRLATSIASEPASSAMAYAQACTLIAGLISTVVYIGIALMVSWQVVAFGITFGILTLYVMKGLVLISRRAGRAQAAGMRALNTKLHSVLSGIKPIKAMGRETHIWPLLESEISGLNRIQRTQVFAKWTLTVLQEPIAVTLLGIGLFVVVSFAGQSFSVVLVSTFLFYRILTRIGGLQKSFQSMASGEGAFWSYADTLRLALDSRERTTRGIDHGGIGQSVSFEGVTFSYDGQAVFRDLSTDLPSHSISVLVGPSGSGKSTFLDLLIGLSEPEKGVIRVDGVSLKDIDAGTWRSRIGYVPQTPVLFHDTIKHNISLGDPSITDEQCLQALKAADALEFVQSRESGLETVVGERGESFSGGQRQRIALARALVCHPDLLILDEATAGLDPESENSICQVLVRLKSSMTIVAVTHQKALMQVADQLFELEAGCLSSVSPVSIGKAG